VPQLAIARRLRLRIEIETQDFHCVLAEENEFKRCFAVRTLLGVDVLRRMRDDRRVASASPST